MTIKETTSVKCCPEDVAVPPQYRCFWPGIMRKYNCLLQRHCKLLTKRPRIHELAIPNFIVKKYTKPCLCRKIGKKMIEMVYPDKRYATRTLQLSYPAVRTFKALKALPAFKRFRPARRNMINRNQRKSQLSLYTYLNASRRPCFPRPEVQKLSKKRKAKLMQRLAELAEPVIPEELPPVDRGEQSEMSAEKLKKLSAPKAYPPGHEKEWWRLTNGARNFVMTPRLLKIAMPNPKRESLNNPDWDKVQPSALKYKASARIKEMAMHVVRNKEDSSFKKDPFRISPNALKAKISNRVKELATPVEKSDTHNREDPFAVSRKALKAKCTPRLAELAKPKEYI